MSDESQKQCEQGGRCRFSLALCQTCCTTQILAADAAFFLAFYQPFRTAERNESRPARRIVHRISDGCKRKRKLYVNTKVIRVSTALNFEGSTIYNRRNEIPVDIGLAMNAGVKVLSANRHRPRTNMISMDPMKASQAKDLPLGDLPLFNWLASQAELKSSAECAREVGLRVIVSAVKPPARKNKGLATFGGFATRAEPAPTTIPEVTAFRKPFIDRRSSEYSWICDEPDLEATCCGAPVVRGKSWCDHHAARVLIKPAR